MRGMQAMRVNKAYIILAIVVAALLLVLMFLANAGVGLLLLTAYVVAICMLYKKKPELFSMFRRKTMQGQAEDGNDSQQQVPDAFRPRIVLINNTSIRPEQIEVDSPNFIIGRSPECNYVLHGNPKVSRQHCRIVFDEASARSLLIDEQSKFGTRVNGETLEHGAPRQIRNGDIVQILDTSFSVQTKNY